MKYINKSITIIVCAILLLQTSCKKSTFTEANTNPNAPNTVFPSMLLSSVEGSLAYAQGGDMSRFTSMFMQQTLGATRQSAAYYQYVLTAQDVDALWGNIYTAVMENDDSLMVQSDRMGYNVYSGVSRVLMAYSLQIMVDCWGTIPYSNALKGFYNLTPSYDVDKGLYDTINSLCDKGIAYLNNPVQGKVTPGAEDVIYGGDATKWIKFAHAIKARLYMHQSKGNIAMATNALSEIANSFTSNADNAVCVFGTTEPNGSPWYQFNENRGDISFVYGNMVQNMFANNDPRTLVYVDTSSAVYGDALNTYYGSISSPVEFITYDELQYMTAEAKIVVGGTGSLIAAQTAFKNAITANMTKLGVATADIDTYLVHNGTLVSTTALSQIANDEYIALYLNPEVWNLWRRTGYPVLAPVSGTNIPRRFLYPQTELSYNKANTPTSTLYTPKVFWDK